MLIIAVILNFFGSKFYTPTSSVSLCLNDLTDASSSNAVLGSQLDFIPGPTAQVLQFKWTLCWTDEKIFPLFCVIYRIL